MTPLPADLADPDTAWAARKHPCRLDQLPPPGGRDASPAAEDDGTYFCAVCGGPPHGDDNPGPC
jgi:hypothetical protein